VYVFCADLYCDECGAALAADPSLIDTGDSDDFPQSALEGESDGPNHCASGRECLDPVDLTAWGLRPDAVLVGAESRLIGSLIGESLTEHGVEYLREMLSEHPRTEYQAALHRLWRDEFDAELPHDPECTGCEHDCPWQGNPMGAPFCSICDDHMEAAGDDS
jgi:hypothetical protein